MLLIVNAGSSSLKLKVYEGEREVTKASVSEIGADGHHAALAQALGEAGVPLRQLTAAAHRVVHGGAQLTATCRITPDVVDAISACVPLAPLHNPANLVGIQAVAALAPGLPQYAAFDTAFHATNPEVATAYALPRVERDRGLRRYGFHGISYAALVRVLRGRETCRNGFLPATLATGPRFARL
jgi:acetate kinase